MCHAEVFQVMKLQFQFRNQGKYTQWFKMIILFLKRGYPTLSGYVKNQVHTCQQVVLKAKFIFISW